VALRKVYKWFLVLDFMVLKKERAKMEEYVVGRLEESGIHVARKVAPDCLQLKARGDVGAYVFMHSNSEGAQGFIHREDGFHRLVYAGNFVTNVFYKDGKEFFVPLSDAQKDALIKKSMKHYSWDEISRMVDLRDKEHEVLRLQGQKRLVYYQPDNTADGGRLREGLVSFVFRPIVSSYSHRNPDEKGYDFIMAGDGERLKRRMISGDRKILDGRLKLMFSRKSPHIAVLDSVPVEEIPNAEQYFLDQTGKTLEDFGGNSEDIREYVFPN